MDRYATSALECPTAMRTARSAALDLLLPAAAGECGELAPAPATRRAVPPDPVLRKPKDGRRTGSEPQTHPAADAHFGHRSHLSQAPSQSPDAGAPDLPVPAARCGNPPAQPRLEYRYYLHSDAWWLPVPGRCDGLVQPFRTQLGTFQYDGNRLLPGGAGCCVSFRPTRNLELRSGFSVHLGRFSSAVEEAWHLDQHGWPRTRTRQGLCFTLHLRGTLRNDLIGWPSFRQFDAHGFSRRIVAGMLVEAIVLAVVSMAANQSMP